MNSLGKMMAVVAVIGVSSSAGFGATIFLIDPTFETPAFSNNTFNYNPTSAFTSTSGIINPPSGFGAPTAPEGSQVAFLQSNTGDPHDTGVRGTISAGLTGLVPGNTYTIGGFEAARGAAGTASFTISINATTLSEAPTSTSFLPFTGTFVATNVVESFILTSTGPSDSTTFIDDLSVTPEPASLSLLGLGGLGLLARRRKA